MTDNTLIKKLKALIFIRVIFITLLLGSFFLLQVGYKSFPHPRATSNLIAALYMLTIIYALLLNRLKSHHAIFAYSQFFMDVLAANILIYLTGGIESWFPFIMPLTVISASAVLNRKAGYLIATFNSIIYGVMIDLQYYKVLPIGYDTALAEKDFLYNIFVHISAIYMVAFLSGYLSSRLEKTTKELEQTDSNLKRLEFFNKELIENIPSGIFTTDINGRVLIFNKAAEDITGINIKTARDMNIIDIFPFIAPAHNGLLDIERTEGAIRNYKEGVMTIGLTVSSLRDDITGERTGFIGIFQDLTRIKKMEAEIKQKEKWAAIGELSANIAHEIRNPLASLKGSIEMLKEDKVAKEHKERLTAIALNEMERLNKIITDFLTYSRPRANEIETFDLTMILNDTLELLENTVSAADNISITKNFNGPLPINADHQKLCQVFWNLGMNSIEAMREGGELSVTAQKKYNHIEVIFTDTGSGISQENIRKIFYPFFTTKDEGTGLGLAIAYRIVEEHSGDISVVSNPGKGTSFKVIIPDYNGKS